MPLPLTILLIYQSKQKSNKSYNVEISRILRILAITPRNGSNLQTLSPMDELKISAAIEPVAWFAVMVASIN